MSQNIQCGYIVSKCQSLYIKHEDCDRYGINPDDFAKVDKNKDGLIDVGEILVNGKNVASINNVYRTLATQNDCYVDTTNCVSQTNKQMSECKYNLFHPNVTNTIIANRCDYLA